MDYWPRLKLTVHDDNEVFLKSLGDSPRWYFDSAGQVDLWSANFCGRDVLIFGSETSGVSESILRKIPIASCVFRKSKASGV